MTVYNDKTAEILILTYPVSIALAPFLNHPAIFSTYSGIGFIDPSIDGSYIGSSVGQFQAMITVQVYTLFIINRGAVSFHNNISGT